ncbi:zinc finger protein 316-like [Lethenteron reissneri]|uniref:zinc finger protein 316-like n=1 Tax=Lethenteron reissneri TaxID=7753 RepID=UPI002AB6D209|nr:zinc finger protein 316-like [Lethenteron reissneri]
MACAAVLPADPDPRGDFPAWLATRGMKPTFTDAMERELGISDYEELLACAEDAQVTAELLGAARDRLPFAFYAVLRRLVRAVSPPGGAEGHGTPATAAARQQQPELAPLLDAIVATLDRLGKELLRSAEKFVSLESVLCPRSPANMCHSDGGDEPARYAGDSAPPGEGRDLAEGDLAEGVAAGRPLKVEPAEDEELYDEQVDTAIPSENNCDVAREEEEHATTLQQHEHTGAVGRAEAYSSEDADLHPHPMHTWDEQEARLQRLADWTRSDKIFYSIGGVRAFHGRPFAPAPPPPPPPPPPPTMAMANTTNSPRRRPLHSPGEVGGAASDAAAVAAVMAGSSSRLHRCDFCGRDFKTRQYLCKHRRTHTGEKPHNCEVCGKAFSDLSNLVRHRSMHTGQKPFECELCGLAFRLKHHLTDHRRTHWRKVAATLGFTPGARGRGRGGRGGGGGGD